MKKAEKPGIKETNSGASMGGQVLNKSVSNKYFVSFIIFELLVNESLIKGSN